MVQRHIARLASPKSWPIKRKEHKWILKAVCGPHSQEKSIPLGLILREMLKHAKTNREVKKILQGKKVFVNKITRKDLKFPVGLFDIIEIPLTKENYRVLYEKKGRFALQPISAEETKTKPYKIVGKRIIKGGRIQISLNDGTTMTISKDQKNLNVNDTLLLALPKTEIKKHAKFEIGAIVYVTGGNKISSIGVIEGVRKFKGIQPDNIICRTKQGTFETSKDYAFVIGKEKPLLDLPEK